MDPANIAAKLDTILAQQQAILDRQAIGDCLARYCRGMDRMDTALTLSAYHADAIDDHGAVCDAAAPFIAWANESHLHASTATQHYIANVSCELDGDVAHTETYWLAASQLKDGVSVTLCGGRYIDRFERRNSEWRIAARKCIIEWGGSPAMEALPPAARAAMNLGGRPARDRTDPSYDRPLEIDPARVGRAINPASVSDATAAA
jgi:hypothetical protein